MCGKSSWPYVGNSGKPGSLNACWKGDDVGYFGIYEWLVTNFGKADHCEFDSSHTERFYEWCNISGRYIRDRNQFKMLCRSCHRKLDKGNFCKNGHKFTPENTWIRSNGWRMCRICVRARQIKHSLKEGVLSVNF